MSRRSWTLGCLAAAALVLAACEDKMMVDEGAPPAPTPTEAVAAAPKPAAVAPPRVRIEESDFVESDRNRDPFRSFVRSFVEDKTGERRNQREVVLSDYSLDELKLIGIVTRMQPAKAMLVDPTGKGHVIQRGQFVGRPDVVQGTGRGGSTYEVNWRVDSIRDGDVVLVRSDPANPDVPTATRVIPLRPEGTRVER
ncbi:MAG TPA: pilus assembly protein PilP [Polyangiaceae bacterium]|nr:pilus assembly protein PilP [Polyangiaceae bacterium]